MKKTTAVAQLSTVALIAVLVVCAPTTKVASTSTLSRYIADNAIAECGEPGTPTGWSGDGDPAKILEGALGQLNNVPGLMPFRDLRGRMPSADLRPWTSPEAMSQRASRA